jgi:Zn-dependent oligopeptidase
MRNEYALKKGFSNYFEYNLKESFEVDLNDLETLLDDVYLKAKEKLETIINKKQNNLKNVFKIDELKQYHYGREND